MDTIYSIMPKSKKRLNKPHNSYKYIAGFCIAFAAFNFFIEKLANQNEGKNTPQVQTLRFNKAQSFKPDSEKLNSEILKTKDNFNNISVKKRKEIFISNLLPVIHNANQEIIKKRNTFFKIEKKIKNNNLNVLEANILKKLFKEYKVKNNDLKELKKRVDIVPISLVIAQAAIESGWGTSRFAIEGNAYFGQKVIGSNVKGIKPSKEDNPLIKVRSFNNLNDSVKAYLNNLNTHFAYKSFRKTRTELRSFGKTLEGEVLVTELNKYSELGNEYIHTVQKIIKKNNLSKFDYVEYTSAKR